MSRVMPLIIVVAVILVGCSVFTGTPQQVLVTEGTASEALSAALSVLGAPYVWAGQGPMEFDCSGLIVWAYDQVVPNLKLRIGSTVVRDATQDELWRYNVQRIPPEDMRPGDIVFITNNAETITHGGLFIEWVDAERTEFRFVNASSFYGEVVIDTWPVTGQKRDQWFVGAGRLLVTL